MVQDFETRNAFFQNWLIKIRLSYLYDGYFTDLKQKL
jgi:hypothetical protein